MATGEARLRSTNPMRLPAYDVGGGDAWALGHDDVDTDSVLL